MTFYSTEDLYNGTIFLQLDRTCEAIPEKNWLPAYHFRVCLRDGTGIGTCSLRVGHNDLTRFGGNIGYGIDAPFRGHHYAAMACALLFRLARRHGMKYVIITCDPSNPASARTCLLAGGQYLETVRIPEGNDMYARGRREAMVWRVDLAFDEFLSAAALFNRHLQVTPLLFGSLGLQRRLLRPLQVDDIDVLLPEKYLKEGWEEVLSLMREAGYTLRDEHEHEFVRGEFRMAFAALESLAPFAKVDIRGIPRVREAGADFLLLELGDYLRVYEASSEDGYRVKVKHKQDRQRIDMIREALEAERGAIRHAPSVMTQYASPDNLKTRLSLHAKYSVNPQGFGPWLASHYPILPGMSVLEAGCGTGEIWLHQEELVRRCARLVLTDLSGGMLAQARETLKKYDGITYAQADIQALPFASNSFDVVIANMMLYHVPDLARALSEVRRVLKSGCTFICATYGEHGIMEYLSGLFSAWGVRDEGPHPFTLQNGKALLQPWFSSVQRLDYEDALEVTDIRDLVDYIASLSGMSSLRSLPRETLMEVLGGASRDGVIRIPKEYGLFLCR